MKILSQTYNQIPLITAPKIDTNLLWNLSFLFIGLAVTYFIFVFLFRNRLSSNREEVRRRKMELSPMISEFLFHEENATKDEKSNYVNLKIEIRQLLKDSFNRKVLSEILLDLRKDVSGDAQERLFKLYQDLGLHTDDFERLKSKRWQIVSKSIINLTQMQVAESYSFVKKHINDKRSTIRKQAEIAIVTLRPEGINYFLDTTKFKISEWQQLKLMDVLRLNEDFQPPRFKAWLTSTNRHVVLFALRLIKFYNQNDADAAIIELVKHKNNQIKEEAIGCIKEFHIVKALPVLKLIFWKSSTDVKISILSAIGRLGTEDDLEFLHLIENKVSNFSVRSKAHASINAIAPGSIMPTKGLLKTSNYTIPEDIEIKDEVEEEEEIETAVQNSEDNENSQKSKEPSESIVKSISKVVGKKFKTKEPQKGMVEKSNTQDEDILNFDFLPVVVKANNEEVIADSNEEKSHANIKEIPIIYDEIKAKDESSTNKKKTRPVEISEEELSFLPIVTDIEEVSEAQVKTTEDISDVANYKNEIEDSEIFDIPVIYDETSNSSDENSADLLQFNLNPYTNERPIADTIDEQLKIKKEASSSNKIEPRDEQKFKKILTDLVAFKESKQEKVSIEEIEDWSLLKFDIEFVKRKESPSIEKESTNALATESKIDFQEKVVNVLANEELKIPTCIIDDHILDDVINFKENTKESRMQLLNDIAKVGDHREIPFLNELLNNNDYKFEKDRITNLIAMLTNQEENLNFSLDRPFNVFEDLFLNCDREAKLILLDEIVAVGDEAEIRFLENLIENDDKRIRSKANKALKELTEKVSKANSIKLAEENSLVLVRETSSNTEILVDENTFEEYDSMIEELQIVTPHTSDIFDIDFQLSEPLSKSNLDKKEKKNAVKDGNSIESIIEQISNFSNKIKDILNG